MWYKFYFSIRPHCFLFIATKENICLNTIIVHKVCAHNEQKLFCVDNKKVFAKCFSENFLYYVCKKIYTRTQALLLKNKLRALARRLPTLRTPHYPNKLTSRSIEMPSASSTRRAIPSANASTSAAEAPPCCTSTSACASYVPTAPSRAPRTPST